MEQDIRKVVMVRFGEIFLKSEPVRREFLNRLRDNIRAGLKGLNVEATNDHPEQDSGQFRIPRRSCTHALTDFWRH